MNILRLLLRNRTAAAPPGPRGPCRPPSCCVITGDGVVFRFGPDSCASIIDAGDYRFDDIRPDDVVVDIGANVGAFCIRAARRSKHVFAVEPVTTDDLRANITLNGADVAVIEGALGDGGARAITWDTRTVVARTYPFREIRAMAGGCDFLKCDCEGGEWTIIPEELADVRRIEMEVHVPPIGGPVNRALLDYISEHYTFEIDRVPGHGVRGVLGVLHATRRA